MLKPHTILLPFALCFVSACGADVAAPVVHTEPGGHATPKKESDESEDGPVGKSDSSGKRIERNLSEAPRVHMRAEQRSCVVDSDCQVIPAGNVCVCQNYEAVSTSRAARVLAYRESAAVDWCGQAPECPVTASGLEPLCMENECFTTPVARFDCIDADLNLGEAVNVGDIKSRSENDPSPLTCAPGLGEEKPFGGRVVLSAQTEQIGYYRVFLESKTPSHKFLWIRAGDCQNERAISCTICKREVCATGLYVTPQDRHLLVVAQNCDHDCKIRLEYVGLSENQ